MHPITAVPSNPFQLQHHAPLPTQTVAARTVFHEAQAAIQPLIAGIQMQEQLDNLLDSFQGIQWVIFVISERKSLTGYLDIRSAQADEKHQEAIHDPPALNPKGRPRSQRMTGVMEGRPQGGGASIPKALGRKCGVCRQEGHTRSTCPLRPPRP